MEDFEAQALSTANAVVVRRIDPWLSEIFTAHPASVQSGKRAATTASIQMPG